MKGCRGNACLLSFHHRALIVSNPLTHTGVIETHTRMQARTHVHMHAHTQKKHTRLGLIVALSLVSQ